MSGFPRLPIHIGDYIKDTPPFCRANWQHHGIYLIALMITWNTPGCRLPDDSEWLCERFGCNQDEFEEFVRPVLSKYFKSNGKWLKQKRLCTEQEFIEKQRGRARSRWQKKKDACKNLDSDAENQDSDAETEAERVHFSREETPENQRGLAKSLWQKKKDACQNQDSDAETEAERVHFSREETPENDGIDPHNVQGVQVKPLLYNDKSACRNGTDAYAIGACRNGTDAHAPLPTQERSKKEGSVLLRKRTGAKAPSGWQDELPISSSPHRPPLSNGASREVAEKEGPAESPHPDPKVDLFRRSKEVYGAKPAGAITAKLLKACGADENDRRTIATARAKVEESSTKANPIEWLMRVINGPRRNSSQLPDGII